MAIQVSGSVTAPAADRSHLEPTDPVTADLPAGSTGDVVIGDVKNTGNVNQTLTITAVNVSGCTVNDFSVGGVAVPVELAPGQAAHVTANVTTPAEAVGSANEPFSFEVDFSWS